MFASKRQSTFIAEGFKIVGTVTAEGLVEVNGQIEGEMHCTSLIVACKAQIAGSITADRVIVDGKVEGPIKGGEVVLKSQAHVVGDIQCQSLIVEKGAFMEGRLMRSLKTNGRPTEGLLSDLTKPAPGKDDDSLETVETSTREAELIVEARHLSGNPNLLKDEAMAFQAKRGNAQSKAVLGRQSHEERSAKAAKN